MTGLEHYLEAERLLSYEGIMSSPNDAARALAHATLALASRNFAETTQIRSHLLTDD